MRSKDETRQKAVVLMKRLEQAGKRRTAQRSAICQAMVEYEGHPTVAELYENVRERFPMISQATVYNTVDTLRELGLITRLDIAHHDHTHYDLNPATHVNVACRYCGAIADVHTPSVAHLITEVGTACGYDIQPEAGLIMYGICPKCRASGRHSRGGVES